MCFFISLLFYYGFFCRFFCEIKKVRRDVVKIIVNYIRKIEWEKIFDSCIYGREINFKINKEFKSYKKKNKNKKMNNLVIIWVS